MDTTYSAFSERCLSGIGQPANSATLAGKAVMEGFFLNLKMERVWQKNYAERAGATNDGAGYSVRSQHVAKLHSKLGSSSPDAFESESTSKKPIKLSQIT